jgi:choline dehydrogenase-like flavoprotein
VWLIRKALMKRDTRSLSDVETIVTDVCIIGGGPAGTMCAREFLGSGLRVALLESGGTGRDARTQALSAGELEGEVHEPLEETHLRQLGGTANHWIIKMADRRYGYRFTPLDPIDFEAREGMPHSGWPITRGDLDPYYRRVHDACGIGPFDYSSERWSSPSAQPLPLPADQVQTSAFMFSPTNVFTTDIPQQISESENVHVYLNATVVELLAASDGGSIQHAVVKTFDGKTIRFAARQFILTCNALQTPRLLLASRRVHPNGIGNDHDVVGRYYMDHSLVPSGNFFPHDRAVINRLELYDMRLVDGASVLGRLQLAPEVMRREQLCNFVATLFPMPAMRDVEALVSVREVAKSLVARQWPENFGKHMANVWGGQRHLMRVAWEKLRYDTPIMPGFGRGGWSRLSNNDRKYERLELLAFVEQSPNPDNRVTLLDTRDELGMPRIKLRFRWDDADLDSIQRAQAIMASALESTGLGRYEPAQPAPGGRLPVNGLHHMAGTTRMHDDPKKGVVNRQGRVHGVGNLFVGGSAVFTTSGYANPTLTNLALTLRVADAVKRELEAQPMAIRPRARSAEALEIPTQ